MKIKSPRVVIFSILALGCIALTFVVDWYFIIPAVILMLLNQKELMKYKKENKKKNKN